MHLRSDHHPLSLAFGIRRLVVAHAPDLSVARGPDGRDADLCAWSLLITCVVKVLLEHSWEGLLNSRSVRAHVRN